MLVALRRRLLKLAGLIGVQAHDLGPGLALLSRRRAPRTVRLDDRTWLVMAPGSRWRLAATAPGLVLIVHDKTARKNAAQVQRTLDRYVGAEHIAWLLRKYSVNCVLDVGAHKGQYATSLRAAGYRGHIVSFEPAPHAIDELEKKASDDPRWSVYPVALGRSDTSMSMNIAAGTFSSLLPPNEFGKKTFKRLRDTHEGTVEVRRLDSLLDEILRGIEAPRPFLKMDTQGYDLEVFLGAGDRVREFVGLQSEVSLLQIYYGMPRMPKAVKIYEDAGFEITGMYPVTREPETARVVEFDCIMVRADSLTDRLGQ